MIQWARLQERLKNFGSEKENIQQKNYSAKTIKNYLQNLHKILKIPKFFTNFLVKFKKI